MTTIARTRTQFISMMVVLAIAAAACSGSDEGTDSTTDNSAGSTQSTEATESESSETTEGTSAPNTSAGSGSATLVVGDQTYEFDNYYCLQGGANTGNDRVSFSSGAFGEVDGVRVQLDASIQDTAEGDAMSGEGTIQSVTLNDIEDFANPSVAWDATTGFVQAPTWVIEYDGSKVTANGTFDDSRTDDAIEEIPGTLEAICGA